MPNDRVDNWRRFSMHMEQYIERCTVEKYQVEASRGCDLMSITRDWKVCVWNILKYALRLWNGNGKNHDLEKICHYAEMTWTLSEGKVVQNKESET